MVVDDSLVHYPSFTDLPYFKLDGTDPDGKVYDDWDFFLRMTGKNIPSTRT